MWGGLVHVNEERQSTEAETNLYNFHIKNEMLLEETEQEKPEEIEVQQRLYLEVENTWNYSLSKACEDQEIKENAGKDNPIQDNNEEEEDRASPYSSSFTTGVNSVGETEEEES